MRTVHLLVFDRFSDWEPSYAVACLNHPAGQAQPGSLRVRTVAASLAPVLTTGGLRIVPDGPLESLRPEDSAMLILPGGAAWETGGNREAAEKAKEFLAADVPVAAIAEATVGLARAGLLDDRYHTSNAAEYLLRTGYQGRQLYQDAPAVTHGDLVTANGMAPMEFAREIFALLGVYPAAEPGSPAAVSMQPTTPPVGQSKWRELKVLLLSDPAGILVSPASRRTTVSIHVGTSVHIGCRRGGQYHCGLNVHGDIDIIPPGIVSRWELKEKDTALILSVPASLLSMTALQCGVDPARVEIVNRFQMRDSQMEHIGWALKAEMESGYRSGRLYFDSLGTAMAACLLDRHSSVSHATRIDNQGMSGRRLREVLSYVEDNLGRELSLKEIAGVAGLSVSHCNTAFRKSVGMPVHQYVIRRRVDRAKALLTEGKLSISQIAMEAGFAHQSHLAYHVRRLLGVSPLSLRENSHNPPAAS
jgi:AraC family transcriptional regulator